MVLRNLVRRVPFAFAVAAMVAPPCVQAVWPTWLHNLAGGRAAVEATTTLTADIGPTGEVAIHAGADTALATSTPRPELAAAGNRSALSALELRAFCGLGIPWACKSSTGIVLDPEERREMRRQRLYAQSGSVNVTRAMPSGCTSAGARETRIFMQVYGVPQRAMADYIECLCHYGEHCRVVRDAGPKFERLKGASLKREQGDDATNSCQPKVCTTSSDFERVAWSGRCGSEYRDAPVFTMLREPILRVYSFYMHMQRWYLPYRKQTLDEVLQAIGKKDLNDGLPKEEMCRFCEAQLSNAMTLNYFCGLGAHECQRLQKQALNATPADMARALDAAKELMSKKLSTVFLEKNNKGFMDNFRAIPALLPAQRTEQQCRFQPGRLEPPLSIFSLPDQTVALITQRNAADMALYSHVLRSMGNVVREV